MISLLVLGLVIITVTLLIYYSYDKINRKKYENYMISGLSLGTGLVFLGGGMWSLKAYKTKPKFNF